jgi:hypothetical protein
MITKKDKQALRVFLPLVLAIVVAIGGESLLAYVVGETSALRGVAVGCLIGVLLLSRQVMALEREMRKLRQPDGNRTP